MQIEISKRGYDEKFAVWAYMVDPCYVPSEITEGLVPYISQRWVMVGVFDDYKAASKFRKEFAEKHAKNVLQFPQAQTAA